MALSAQEKSFGVWGRNFPVCRGWLISTTWFPCISGSSHTRVFFFFFFFFFLLLLLLLLLWWWWWWWWWWLHLLVILRWLHLLLVFTTFLMRTRTHNFQQNQVYLWFTPQPITVTTRIIPFFVGKIQGVSFWGWKGPGSAKRRSLKVHGNKWMNKLQL